MSSGGSGAPIARADLVLGQAVEAEEHVVGRKLGEGRSRSRGPGLRELGLSVEGAEDRDGQRVVGAAEQAHDLGRRRGRDRGGVLRKQREHDQPVDPRPFESPECRGDRGAAVAHRELHPVALAQSPRDALAQGQGMDHQGRSIGRPDRAIGSRRLARSGRQDHEIEQQPAQRRRQGQHPRVAQEFPQISPDRSRRRGIRRSEVDEQAAGSGSGVRVRVGGGSHVVRSACRHAVRAANVFFGNLITVIRSRRQYNEPRVLGHPRADACGRSGLVSCFAIRRGRIKGEGAERWRRC
jgi:hypothetical protein